MMIRHSVLPGNQSFGHPDFFFGLCPMSDAKMNHCIVPSFGKLSGMTSRLKSGHDFYTENFKGK